MITGLIALRANWPNPPKYLFMFGSGLVPKAIEYSSRYQTTVTMAVMANDCATVAITFLRRTMPP